MPIIKSAKKAARQTTKRNKKNEQIKKASKAALNTVKANPTPENLSKAQSEYDKATKKGLIKKNTASRRKAALVKITKAKNIKPIAKTAKIAKKPAAKAPAKKVAAKPAATKKATPAKKPAAKKTSKGAKAASN